MYPKVFADFAARAGHLRPGRGAADAGLFLRHAAGRGDLRRHRERQDAGHALPGASARPTRRAWSRCSSSSTASRAASRCRTARMARRASGAAQGRGRQRRACRRADAGRRSRRVAVAAGQTGQGRRRAAVDRGDEDGNRAPRRSATARSPRCWCKPATRSTPRTCWWCSGSRPRFPPPQAGFSRKALHLPAFGDRTIPSFSRPCEASPAWSVLGAQLHRCTPGFFSFHGPYRRLRRLALREGATLVATPGHYTHWGLAACVAVATPAATLAIENVGNGAWQRRLQSKS